MWKALQLDFPTQINHIMGKDEGAQKLCYESKRKKLRRKGEEKMLDMKMHYLDLAVLLVAQREGLIL